MSLLEHPDARPCWPTPPSPPTGPRLPGPAHHLPPALSPAVLPRRAADPRRPRHPRTAQRAAAKTCEPIAVEAGVHRKPVQNFVGAGGWDDEAVMAELRGHVREELADPQAVLILDPSAFPKSGSRVLRRGPPVVRPAGQAGELPARRLPGLRRARRATPRWTAGCTCPRTGLTMTPGARSATSPRTSTFQETWRIAVDLLAGALPRTCPTPGSCGDDEFGRAGRVPSCAAAPPASVMSSTCRATPTSATWSAVAPAAAAGPAASGRCRSCAADAWAARQPDGRWTRLTVRDGEKGPLVVDAMARAGADQGGAAGRAGGAAGGDAHGRSDTRTDYSLSNAGPEVPLVRTGAGPRFTRHRIEEVFGAARAKSGWGSTRCGAGWAGTTT